MPARLNVNIDHVATVREARKTIEPNVLAAARTCEEAGAHGITVHLRGDRRHIQDNDVRELKKAVTTYLNLEMSTSEEMLALATDIKPDAVSLVPESPNEVTTEGGLNVVGNFDAVRNACVRLRTAGVMVSIFIDPDHEQIECAKKAGAQQIEICTAEYAEKTLGHGSPHGEGAQKAQSELSRIGSAAAYAKSLGLEVAAGHGLTTANVVALAQMPEITEFNIGHHIISRSIFIGLDNAVREMLTAISS